MLEVARGILNKGDKWIFSLYASCFANHIRITMLRCPRRNLTSAFKSKVALAAVRGEKTMSEFAQQFDVHRNQIKLWRDQLL